MCRLLWPNRLLTLENRNTIKEARYLPLLHDWCKPHSCTAGRIMGGWYLLNSCCSSWWCVALDRRLVCRFRKWKTRSFSAFGIATSWVCWSWRKRPHAYSSVPNTWTGIFHKFTGHFRAIASVPDSWESGRKRLNSRLCAYEFCTPALQKDSAHEGVRIAIELKVVVRLWVVYSCIADGFCQMTFNLKVS